MEKIVPDLPTGRIDLICNGCKNIYEYMNRRFYNTPNELPVCPHCGATEYKRAYTTMPTTRVQRTHWYASANRLHSDINKPSHLRKTFTDGECQAMATAHSLNTGELVDWRDVKKEVNTKIWGFNKK